ncbi:MAG: hypothetical protein HN467_11290 [Opitutae bacterium]|nr:hypothetical protein [Opitutae bacterium]
MKTNRTMLVLTFLFTLPCIGAEDKKEEFQSIFNGRNLDGWVKVITAPTTCPVKNLE